MIVSSTYIYIYILDTTLQLFGIPFKYKGLQVHIFYSIEMFVLKPAVFDKIIRFLDILTEHTQITPRIQFIKF